ncbi:hypothetical protein JRO89_XS12G0087900 [Xanthoceras sorbifolium]|uniref:RNase H type-1 domain-containing protein n=1 Tax=Xanthoceras sorbifolium TaxID=99658 RepID=A0ABQ8HBV8_9ROSI|nr:hypothetical protein JRO89_XS12G0087900 [Xanthoceras sorbifolium]
MAYYGGDYYDQGRKRKEPASSGGNFYYKASPPKRFKEEAVHQNTHFECGLIFTGKGSCILKFDGCCKGNPGKGGAGAVLRSANGDFVLRLCEGVGDTKSNAAEYRAVILGLKHALEHGFTHIRVLGDYDFLQAGLFCISI